jgi:hypothetical protein
VNDVESLWFLPITDNRSPITGFPMTDQKIKLTAMVKAAG